MAVVQIQGTSGAKANVTPDGKLSVDAQVTATVADSKIKGSPDNGTSWLPVKVDSSGQLLVAIPAGVTLSGSSTQFQPRLQWEDFINEGIDKYFNCRLVMNDGAVTYGLPSTYWKRNSSTSELGTFVVPGDTSIVALYSKQSFRNGVMTAYAKFTQVPVLPGTNVVQYLGFEGGAANGTTAAYFRYTWDGTTASLFAKVGGIAKGIEADISSYLPANHSTAHHHYEIKMGTNIVYFKIDDTVVAIFSEAETTDGSAPFVHQNVPYVLVTGIRIPRVSTVLVEMRVNRGTGDTNQYSWTLSPYDVRISEDLPEKHLVLPLYSTASNTKLLNTSVASGELYSAWFPLLVNTKVVILASQAFTLARYNRAAYGNQLGYKVDADVNGQAGTELVTSVPRLNGVGRVKITPTSYPCTFDIAEVAVFD